MKIALDSRKLNEVTVKKKAQMPNMEELISRISRKISEEQEGEIWITKLDFDYAYGQSKLNENTRKSMHFYCYRRRIYGILPVPESILWTGRHPNNFPGTDRQNAGIQTPRLARRHHNRNQRNNRKRRTGSERNNGKIRRSRIQTTPEEM